MGTELVEADPPATLLEAFHRIRVADEMHMDELDALGVGWTEETVTEVAIHKGTPFVKAVPFYKGQEGIIGADWLWWWLDNETQECFGMLVQAKRLKHEGKNWTLDIRQRDGQQLGDLLASAAQLEVPAIYAAYTGGRLFRTDMPCLHGDPPACATCDRMAITVTSAYQLCAVHSPRDTATLLLADGIALEDLVDPDQPVGVVEDLNLKNLEVGELRSFLTEPQSGPREVAKRIFEAVSLHRRGAFSQATAESTRLAGAKLFPEVPLDRGHFPGPYFEHFLNGLRTSPPAYVLDLLADAEAPDELKATVAGVMLIST